MLSRNALAIDSWMNVTQGKFVFNYKSSTTIEVYDENEKIYYGCFSWGYYSQKITYHSLSLQESISKKIFSEEDLEEAWLEYLKHT